MSEVVAFIFGMLMGCMCFMWGYSVGRLRECERPPGGHSAKEGDEIIPTWAERLYWREP